MPLGSCESLPGRLKQAAQVDVCVVPPPQREMGVRHCAAGH